MSNASRRFWRLLAVPVAMLGFLAVGAQPTSADTVGGCNYNCAGDYRMTTPATLLGVSTRGDLGTIGVNIDRGYVGDVLVEAWVYHHGSQRWVAYKGDWFADNYNASYSGTPGGLLSFDPGTRGWHSVYVRLSYANGYTAFSGYPQSYNNYWFDGYQYRWNANTHAFL